MQRGRPVLGVLGGLLLGLGGAVLIQQFGLWPLDALLLYGLPVVCILIGVMVARMAPFGKGR
jgi:cell division protein FtsX